MMMKLLHAFAAVLTVIFYLMRRNCVMGRACLTKHSSRFDSGLCSYGDSSQTSVQQLNPVEDCMFCARGPATDNVYRMPKYKRDPDIQIDNEHIGVHPRG